MAFTLVVAAVGALYAVLISSEGDTPAPWFVGSLAMAVGLLLYAATHRRSFGPAALSVAGLILLATGTLALLSIGLPLVMVGAVVSVLAWKRLPEVA